MLRLIGLCVIAGMMLTPVLAQDRTEDGRYQLEKTDDGYLRLDTRTGAVSHCRGTGGDWACRSVADDRAALEAEIDRLSGEIAVLRKRVDEDAGSDEPIFDLPSREEVDELMDFMEDVMERFNEMADRLNEEFNRPKPTIPPEKIPEPDKT